ncbi:glyoxylase-like metal-dependent hydrolase (beta-lactamase superfamily II) [Sphingomonas sp. UYAg733]
MRETAISLIRAGHCIHPQRMTIRDGSWRSVVYPALSVLIIHPVEGPMLFDTGYDPAFFDATTPFPERFYRWLTPVTLAAGSEVASQLARFGLAPGDIRHLILSHFHADHIAGAHAFPTATIHCSRAGLDAACSGGRIASVRRGVLRALLPSDIAVRARFFENAPRVALPGALQPFDMGADILGDGSLLAVELPGHCPGHWGLVSNDQAHGEHFLVADAAWSTDAIRRDMPPPAITSNFLGSAKRVEATLRQLNALWRRNPAIRLTPAHCPERAAEAGQ